MSAAKPVSAIPPTPIWLQYQPIVSAALFVGLMAGLATHSALPVVLLPVLAAAGVARARRTRFHRRSAAQRSAVVALCVALRAELDGGALPHAALAEAVWCRVELRDLADRLARSSGTPSPQLTGTSGIPAGPAGLPCEVAELLAVAAAIVPGRGGLSGLAACWRATEEHGLSLSTAVAGIESALRAEEQRQLLLDAELSGVRTTMGLLAVLPVFGLLLGSSVGTRPLHTLLQTFGGQVCLLLGSALELIGLWWTDRLVASVSELSTPAPGNGAAGGAPAAAVRRRGLLWQH